MDNQEIDNQNTDIDRKELIINLKKTVKKLQLTLDKINQSEIQKFPPIDITNSFIESSNNLIDNIKLAPRFKVNDVSDDIVKNIPSSSPATRKFSFDLRLGAIALSSVIIIIAIGWTLLKPTPETTIQNQDTSPIVAIEIPSDQDSKENLSIPQETNSSTIAKDLNTEIDNSTEIVLAEDNQSIENRNDTPDISSPITTENNIPKEENQPPSPSIEEQEVEIIIEEKIVSALTMEQTLLNNIQEQIDQITNQYGKSLIINLRANFRNNYLLITLTQNWYQMNDNEQDNFVNDVYQRAKLLYFDRINFQDDQGNLVARNAFIGDQMIVTQR